MNKKHNNTDHWLAQHCMCDKTDQKHNMQRKKQRSVCSNVCKYSETPVLSWSFPYQEMPGEIRAVTDAKMAGELEGLRPTSCGWIYFGGHLLETYSSTQQTATLSTSESEYISITKGAAHALEVRSAMVVFGITFNVLCETDPSAGRAVVTRRGVGRVRHLDARLLWLQQLCTEGVVQVLSQAWRAQRGRLGNKDGRFEANDFAFERNTPSTANGLEFMDGGADSPPRLQKQHVIAVYSSGT